MSIYKLMRIGRWSEPRFVVVFQMVDVIREADANETSEELGLALPGNLGGESQLRIPKLEPDTMLSNIVPLESLELEYHDETYLRPLIHTTQNFKWSRYTLTTLNISQ